MKSFLYGLALTVFINYPVSCMESLKEIELRETKSQLLESYSMTEVLSHLDSSD